eukprot:scaffold14.g1098.t1
MARRSALLSLLCCVLLVVAVRAEHVERAERSWARKLLQYSVRIVGGTQAPVNRFPYICSLRDYVTDGHFCGGMLIADRVVLTAAHCVNTTVSSRRFPRVHVGRFQLTGADDYTSHRATTTVLHEGYVASTSENDLALLFLDSSSSKSPLALPGAGGLTLAANQLLVAAGWGTTAEGSMTLSPTLQQASALVQISRAV